MKQQLVLLARYDVWVNERFAHMASALSPEKLTKPLVSSFPSILETFRHIYETNYAWMASIAGEVNTSPPREDFEHQPFEAFLRTSLRLLKVIEDSADEWIAGDITLSRSGRSVTLPVYGIFHHLLNHATYHRGQLTTLLRQVGVTDFPRTDFFIYLLEREAR